MEYIRRTSFCSANNKFLKKKNVNGAMSLIMIEKMLAPVTMMILACNFLDYKKEQDYKYFKPKA